MKIKNIFFKETIGSHYEEKNYNGIEYTVESETTDTIEQIKNTKDELLASIQQTQKEKKEYTTPELEKYGEIINTLLGTEELLTEKALDNINEIQKELLGPEYRNNPEAQRLYNISEILTMPADNIEQAFEKISKVLDDKNIPMIIKIKIAKYLSNNFLGYMVEGNETIGYISDPGKGVELSNMLIKKYPKYSNYFDNSVLVSDPEGGEIYTNNF